MFGDRIKILRTSHNLSQVQLAEQLNVSKQTVSNWENNNILPSIEMLIKIALFFSVSTDYLLEMDNRTYIEISGLSNSQLAHIQQIIQDILGTNKKSIWGTLPRCFFNICFSLFSFSHIQFLSFIAISIIKF